MQGIESLFEQTMTQQYNILNLHLRRLPRLFHFSQLGFEVRCNLTLMI